MGIRLFLLLTLLPFGSFAVVAQGTPPGEDVPCAVEPRPLDDLIDLWFDPAGTPSTPSPTTTQASERALDLTLGEPADAAVVEAIETVAQAWTSCTNAGDFPAIYSLFTDDHARRQAPAIGSRDEASAFLEASPVPVSPEARRSVGPAHNARVFPDGQVGATFAAVGVREPGIAYTVYMAFGQEDGEWRLDRIIRLIAPHPVAPVWGYRVVGEFPHDTGSYTQGLDFSEGELYEGTGIEGDSELLRVNLETGEVLQSRALDPEQFGEGIVVLNDRIYQLTWQSGIAYVYDRETFEPLETFTYETEGWGLTTDGERLIMSDGTSRLVFRDPETFEQLGVVDVQDGGLPVSNLNELEYVDGEVWANVYTTNWIVRIDPANGKVTGWIDMTGLLPEDHPEADVAEVLNGIAWEPDTGTLIVTGKYWPAMFEIELIAPE